MFSCRAAISSAFLILLAACASAPPPVAPSPPAPKPAPAAPPRAERPFEQELQALVEQLQPTLAESAKLAEQGRLEESDALILEAVPRAQWNGVHYFLLGNLFFGQRDELSLELLRQAHRAYPQETRTNLEYALALHRAGRCEEALPLYEVALAKSDVPTQWHAMRAECLLRTGKPKEATFAWLAASYETSRLLIDRAVHAVHGEPRPLRRWHALRTRIAAGELDLAAELIHLDIRWDIDWWNVARQAERLERDLAWLATLPKMPADELRALRLYAQLSGPKQEAEAVRGTLEDAGLLLGPDARLPDNALLVKGLFAAALRHGAATHEELLVHAPELERRSREGGDAEALSALSFLSAQQPPEARLEIEQRGWERHADHRFGIGALVLQAALGELKPDSPLLQTLREQHPDETLVQGAALELSLKSGEGVAEAFQAAALAEFSSLSPGHAGKRSCDRLNALMHGLREQLGVPLPTPPMQPRYELKASHLDGDRLQLLIETRQTFRMGRSQRTRDVRGYLITATLSQAQGQPAGLSIVGPLWHSAGERSSLSYEAGAMYSEQDQRLAAVHPRAAFDDQGRLIAWRVGDGASARALELDAGAARWAPLSSGPADPEQADDGSGLPIDAMHALRKGRRGWRLLHRPSGREVRDRWLERVAKDLELRMTRDLGDSVVQLDAARRHLLLLPDRVWRKKPREEGAEPEPITTFRFGAGEHPRERHGLVYSRPGAAAKLFARPAEGVMLERADAVVDVAGEPQLLVSRGDALELFDMKGQRVHRTQLEGLGERHLLRIFSARVDAATGRLRLVGSWLAQKGGTFAVVPAVLEWDMGRGEILLHDVSVERVLGLQGDDFVPVEELRVALQPFAVPQP